MAVTQIKAVPAFRKTAETFTSGAKTLEQKYFVSQEIFGEEQEKIFSTQWILVGHQSAIAQAGEYFIFVNLASASTERGGYKSLEEWFTPLAGKFSHWNLPQLRSAKRIEYDVHANWKLIFENYSECYHCPGVHPALSKLTPYDSAEN